MPGNSLFTLVVRLLMYEAFNANKHTGISDALSVSLGCKILL
jgi:hypothetical protein